MLVVEGEFACMVETVVVPSACVKARVNMPREDTTCFEVECLFKAGK